MIPDDKVKSMKSVSEAVEGIEWILAHPDDAKEEMERVFNERTGSKDSSETKETPIESETENQ
jgi:hypothetical protein